MEREQGKARSTWSFGMSNLATGREELTGRMSRQVNTETSSYTTHDKRGCTSG